MIEIATKRRWEKAKHEHNKDAKYGIYRYRTRFGFPSLDSNGNVIGANIYSADLVIRNASDGKKYLYDIVGIKKDTTSSAWLSQRIARVAGGTPATQKGNVSANTIPQSGSNVNTEELRSDRDGESISNRILYANKNSQKNKANPSVQFADVLLSSDYSKSLADFKKIVKSKFAGTIFENNGLPKLSDRDSSDKELTEYKENHKATVANEMLAAQPTDGKLSGRDPVPQGLSSSEHNRLTMKKPIKVSNQEWAMIKAQRKSKYSGLEESDIPVIDFFRIGDYRTINKGYIYYIRNSGADIFTVVMRKRIVAKAGNIYEEVSKDGVRRDNAEPGPGFDTPRSEQGTDHSGSERSGNRGELPQNDRGAVESQAVHRNGDSWQGDADSGRVRNSDRDGESISNRSLLANAFEDLAQTDLERKRLREYKDAVDKLNAEELQLLRSGPFVPA